MLLLLFVAVAPFCGAVRSAKWYGPEDDLGQTPMDVFRLPNDTRPESYDLLFIANLNGTGSTFSGVTRIVVSVSSATRVVTLNLKDLTVINATVTDVGDGTGPPGDPMLGTPVIRAHNEQLEIHLSTAVVPGRRYLVTVTYAGDIRTDATGFYASSYAVGNETKWLAVTHLQPVFARRAFPCYDEPAYKAVFNVSVVKPKGLVALSNMPVRTVNDASNDMEMVSFESTPMMSSYLVAIFVGEFTSSKNNSVITFYARENSINKIEYIEVEAPKHLQVLEEYTGIKYMLPKLDMLAIPDDYFKGMENWGINIYDEKYLLMDERSKNIMIATRLVQHEFTHQWIGNLVTCSWWDYAWLNEGFAKYFEYFATGMVKTNWPMEELFVVEAFQEALSHDQYPRYPITRSVYTPDQIEYVFDTITYSKAASVLRMLKHFVTESVFQTSFRDYLNKNRENVVEPKHLYESFDNVLLGNNCTLGDELTVNQFMTNWTLQSGYPVLNIIKDETLKTFSITQSRFFMDAADAKEHNNNVSAWHIGLTYTTETSKNFNDTKPFAWTNKTSNLTTVPSPSDCGWYIFNIQSSGFYRVNYDTDNWMALTRQLKESPAEIHVLNRAQLMDDAFNLARAGHLSYSIPLGLSEYLVHEPSLTPWHPTMKGLFHLINHMPRRAQGYKTLKAHLVKLVGVIYRKLDDLASNVAGDFNVESVWDEFAWAYTLDNKYCAAKALESFKKWQSGEKIPEIFMKAAFCMGVKNSTGSSTFDQMFKLYTTTKSVLEKECAGMALGCSENRTQLTEYINHILDGPSGLILQYEFRAVIFALSVTPLGLEVLFEFLSSNWNRTLNELYFGKLTVNHIYSVLVFLSTDDSELQKIKDLKNNLTIPVSVRSLFEESLYDINLYQQKWFDMYPEGIGQWALKYDENESKLEPQITVTEILDDINQYQQRLLDAYPERISRWALEHSGVNEVITYKLQSTAPKHTNYGFVILLFALSALLLCTLFYWMK